MITIGTRKVGDRYVGVLRNGRTEIIACGHELAGHINRDMRGRGGPAARECIAQQVRATIVPALREQLIHEARTAWQRLSGGGGFQVPQSTIDRVRRNAEQEAAETDQKITTIAELLAEHSTAVRPHKWGGGVDLIPAAE